MPLLLDAERAGVRGYSLPSAWPSNGKRVFVSDVPTPFLPRDSEGLYLLQRSARRSASLCYWLTTAKLRDRLAWFPLDEIQGSAQAPSGSAQAFGFVEGYSRSLNCRVVEVRGMNQELAETLKRASVALTAGLSLSSAGIDYTLFVRSVRTFGAARREWTNLYPLEVISTLR